MNYIFGISGFAGIGKDEFCRRLVSNYGATHIGLIDPGKRTLHEIYGFSEKQLFGPSKYRNYGDLRYPKAPFFEEKLIRTNIKNETGKHFWVKSLNSHIDSQDCISEGDPKYWLSPREALQQVGELLNNLYQNTWIDLGLKTHQVLAEGGYKYSRMEGLKKDNSIPKPKTFISCFSDFRHHNEIHATRKLESADLKTILIRIKSCKIPQPQHDHKSEIEQTTIPDSHFDFIIQNDGTLMLYHEMIDKILYEVFNTNHLESPESSMINGST